MLEVELDFEFAPSSFVLQSLGASGKWIDEFATDTNILRTAKLPLAGGPAYGVRLVMNKAHATQAVLGGHSIFGVRSFKVLAPLMRPVVEPCVVAAKSSDARDKYFAVAVGSFDPSSGAELRSELPALDSAGAAVASLRKQSQMRVHARKALPSSQRQDAARQYHPLARVLEEQKLASRKLCLSRPRKPSSPLAAFCNEPYAQG